jgi:nitric oxide reductase activation protein
MGAAVRHATAAFSDIAARTKLLIIISDGFPNDIDYKRDYALADTRRSLLEARTQGIIVHSITINIAGDARLDDLYGRVRHSVISDVRELPDRLIRIYGRLTG